jgi:hypothetical protein
LFSFKLTSSGVIGIDRLLDPDRTLVGDVVPKFVVSSRPFCLIELDGR